MRKYHGRRGGKKMSKSGRAHSLHRKTKRIKKYGVSRGGIRL